MTDTTTTPQPLEQVTVNLAPRASAALKQAAGLTGYSRTDVINRALQVYAYVEQTLHDGGEIFVRASGDAAPQQFKIF